MPSLLRPDAPARPSVPRDRLLATASGIFYAEGIRHVGIERIIATAGVTKATFYRHFPSKEDLVLAYLAGAHAAIESGVDRVRSEHPDPAAALRAVTAAVAHDLTGEGFRGCAFINAAAEYPDPASPVHRLVLEHRAWFAGVVEELLTAAGAATPDRAAAHYVMLRDGAMVAGDLADAAGVATTLVDGVDGLIRVSTSADG